MTTNTFQIAMRNAGNVTPLVKALQLAIKKEFLMTYPDVIVLPLSGTAQTNHLEPEGDKLRLVFEFQITTKSKKEEVPPSGE